MTAHDKQQTPSPASQMVLGIPAGWKLVPIKPTEDMLGAALGVHESRDGEDEEFFAEFRRTYRAMVQAAPDTPAAQPASADHVVGSLDDKTITDLAWKHFGESVFILLTCEKSEPMIPQETYDVPTFQLRQFVDACVHAALATATEGSGE